MKKQTLLIAVAAVVVIIAIGIVVSLQRPKQPVAVKEEKARPSLSAQTLFDKAETALGGNELLKAKEDYLALLSTTQDNQVLVRAQEALYDVNMKILFSPIETEQTVIYEVAPGDNLYKIAKKFRTTVELIKKSNNLASDVIRPTQRLRIWTDEFSVIVDKSQNILTLKSGQDMLKIYNVATGKNNSTPVGKFTVVSKLVDPVWYTQGAIVAPDSPENILGTRWLGISSPGYGIHGTTEPDSIGKQLTAGCVRMRNAEVEELFDILPVGSQVEIID